MSIQKKLDTDQKAIQKIEFVGQLKNIDSVNADGTQSIIVLTIFKKIKETRLTFSHKEV